MYKEISQTFYEKFYSYRYQFYNSKKTTNDQLIFVVSRGVATYSSVCQYALLKTVSQKTGELGWRWDIVDFLKQVPWLRIAISIQF